MTGLAATTLMNATPAHATPTLLAATMTEVSVALATKTFPATDFSVVSMTSAHQAHAQAMLIAAIQQLEPLAHVMTDTKVDYLFNYIYFNYFFLFYLFIFLFA